MAVAKESSSSAQSGSASNGAYYLAKCVLKGSVILQIVYGHIRHPTSPDIVFGKETSIELVIIGKDGVVQSVCEQAVFGTIKDLAILPWNEKFSARNPEMLGKDLLVIISDSGKLSILTFCNEMCRFFPVTHIQLSKPGNSWRQLGRMLTIDSNGCFIAVGAYEYQLALFSVSMSAGSNIIDKKIFSPSENEADRTSARAVHRSIISGTIWSMCFISKDLSRSSKEQNPVLAILLNRRGAVTNELLLLEWSIREHAIHVVSEFGEGGCLALNIVEVPHSYGFALLFRVGDALLMDLRDAHNPCCVYRTSLDFLPSTVEDEDIIEEYFKLQDVDDVFNVAARALLELGDMRMDIVKGDDPMSIDSDSCSIKSFSKYVCSWCWEPRNGNNPRIIFCVDTGDFFMMEIYFDSDGFKVNLSDSLYKGLPCKALLWVESGLLAALVDMGDGMVLKLEEEKLVYCSSIQNIAPILDMSVLDDLEEKYDQMFACCGVAPEGSLRIIRSGVSVDKLLSTAPIYQGVTGTWTVGMKLVDSYHSFLVLSFVEETRVLSVGLSFIDVTDSVGFQPNVCTLACGLVGDSMLVQVHQDAVRLCLPTTAAHPAGISLSSPISTSWFPDKLNISLGAVGHNLIVVSTSNPCFLFILGVRSVSTFQYEIYEKQHVRLQNELSCISIPRKHLERNPSTSFSSFMDVNHAAALPVGVDIINTFVIGTHKPSVEVLSFLPDRGLRVLAVGIISLRNTMGTAISECIPQDVRIVVVDRFYVLSGLRNGMLLRFEWSAVSGFFSLVSSNLRPSTLSCLGNADTVSSHMAVPDSIGPQICTADSSEPEDNNSVFLQLIAIRRVGITPVFLVPLSDSLDADIIALSDRPWLLHTARHSLAYTSISFQPSTHVTPVCSVECPAGVLFVAESSLHLVEMVHRKRLNVQKFQLQGTPRKVLYHSESRLLLVMRTDLSCVSCSSDICCIDPLCGLVLSTFKFERGETGKSMELVRVGNEQVVVIGTSLSSGRAIMPSGEAESTKGRLIVLCLEHVQNSDSGSMTFCSKAGPSSQQTSPFREIVGYAAEQLSSSSLCSSPDDTSCDGIKLEETESWQLRLAFSTTWPGMVLAICPYLDRYFLASAGNAFFVCGFPNDNPQRLRRFAVARTRFMIMSLTAQFARIAVGDCRDGILFYSYHEEIRKLEQLYSDPEQRLVADCILTNVDTAVVTDRKGGISILSCSDDLEDSGSPERNLRVSCSYYMGEIAMRIRKGLFSYKLPTDDVLKGCDGPNSIICPLRNSIIASTLLGSIIVFIPISREEHELLEAVQSRLAAHPLTAPILGNDHNEFRSRENQAPLHKILDGDLLAQFLDLRNAQQEAILGVPVGSPDMGTSRLKLQNSPIRVSQVMQILERVHYVLN